MMILLTIASNTILVTTNTDKQILRFKKPELGSTDLLILDETEKQIQKEEMKKVIKKIFNNEEENFAETLFGQTQGNLNLIFLFFNH